jgi:galactonate dehydratase
MHSRRQFLSKSLTGVASLAIPGTLFLDPLARKAQAQAAHSGHFTIKSIERIPLKLPFREIPKRAMDRELPHWRWTEIFQVTLNSGLTGWGETLLYYTWGVSTDQEVQRCLGKNAADLMWDDSLGAGLQMALFDAVAKTMELPVHRLLGRQVHKKTPLSWWNIDTSADDMAAECATALKLGYRSYKTKGRPWFDIHQQVEKSAQIVPDDFKIDMDFNATLLDADRGMPILKSLEKYPQIDIYESPIPQSDVEGNRRIREATRVHIALHYGNPTPRVVVERGVCDGFVVGGGASSVLKQAAFCSQVKMPFWLQLVGTGITAAYSLHFGAVSSQAIWPAVNCHQLYSHDLLKTPILLETGFAKVPETPGIGYEIDPELLQKYRVEKPAQRPNPRRMVETRWVDGSRMYFAATETNFMLNAAMKELIPYYQEGADTRLFPDDGSEDWEDLYQRALTGPVSLKP